MTDFPSPPGSPDPFGSDGEARPPSPPPPPAGSPQPPPSFGAPPPPPTASGSTPGYPAASYPPEGYAAYGAVGYGGVPPEQKSGMLLAGGIVGVILACFIGLIALAFLAIANEFDDFFGFGGSIRLIGLLILAVAIFGFVGGIGAIMRKQWGRICSIVFGGMNLLLAVMSLVGDGSDGVGGSIVYIAIAGAIVFLCAKGPASP